MLHLSENLGSGSFKCTYDFAGMKKKGGLLSDKNHQKRMSLHEIKPCLPLEIWKIVFDAMTIDDKLLSSAIIVEFQDFYASMLKDFSYYSSYFQDKLLEGAALKWIKMDTSHPDAITSEFNTINGISHSIYLSKNLIEHLGKDNENPVNRIEFYNEEANDINSNDNSHNTCLRVISGLNLRLEILDLRLPTGKYNIYFKVYGLCKVSSIASLHTITIKHSLPFLKNEVGYINHRKHLDRNKNRIVPFWRWIPVNVSGNSSHLVTVDCNFEKGDRLSVELSNSVPGQGIYNLSFHVIKFVLAAHNQRI